MNTTPNVKSNLKKNIFISYRVHDTAGETGRLVDSLKQYFEEDQIFMDIDKLEPGVDFKEVISESLEACDVMLAVIGPNWTGSKNAAGVTRINQPNDWVRLELATALQRNIRVVPVLVDGGALPEESELPQDLRSLLERQSYEISNRRWKYDTDQLISFLEKSVGIRRKTIQTAPKTTRGTSLWLKGSIGVLAVLGLLALIGIFINEGEISDNKQSDTVQPTYSNPAKNEVPQVTANEVVAGTWNESTANYYTVITQANEHIELKTYLNTGQNSGLGYGSVNGKRISFRITTVSPVLELNAVAILSDDGSVMKGTVSVTDNRGTYSEPFTWIKR